MRDGKGGGVRRLEDLDLARVFDESCGACAYIARQVAHFFLFIFLFIFHWCQRERNPTGSLFLRTVLPSSRNPAVTLSFFSVLFFFSSFQRLYSRASC